MFVFIENFTKNLCFDRTFFKNIVLPEYFLSAFIENFTKNLSFDGTFLKNLV